MTASGPKRNIAVTTEDFMFSMVDFVKLADARLSTDDHNIFSYTLNGISGAFASTTAPITESDHASFRISAYEILRKHFQGDDIGKTFRVTYIHSGITTVVTLNLQHFYTTIEEDLKSSNIELIESAHNLLASNAALAEHAPHGLKKSIAPHCILFYAREKPKGYEEKLAYWKNIHELQDFKLSEIPFAAHFRPVTPEPPSPATPRADASVMPTSTPRLN